MKKLTSLLLTIGAVLPLCLLGTTLSNGTPIEEAKADTEYSVTFCNTTGNEIQVPYNTDLDTVLTKDVHYTLSGFDVLPFANFSNTPNGIGNVSINEDGLVITPTVTMPPGARDRTGGFSLNLSIKEDLIFSVKKVVVYLNNTTLLNSAAKPFEFSATAGINVFNDSSHMNTDGFESFTYDISSQYSEFYMESCIFSTLLNKRNITPSGNVLIKKISFYGSSKAITAIRVEKKDNKNFVFGDKIGINDFKFYYIYNDSTEELVKDEFYYNFNILSDNYCSQVGKKEISFYDNATNISCTLEVDVIENAHQLASYFNSSFGGKKWEEDPYNEDGDGICNYAGNSIGESIKSNWDIISNNFNQLRDEEKIYFKHDVHNEDLFTISQDTVSEESKVIEIQDTDNVTVLSDFIDNTECLGTIINTEKPLITSKIGPYSAVYLVYNNGELLRRIPGLCLETLSHGTGSQIESEEVITTIYFSQNVKFSSIEMNFIYDASHPSVDDYISGCYSYTIFYRNGTYDTRQIINGEKLDDQSDYREISFIEENLQSNNYIDRIQFKTSTMSLRPSSANYFQRLWLTKLTYNAEVIDESSPATSEPFKTMVEKYNYIYTKYGNVLGLDDFLETGITPLSTYTFNTLFLDFTDGSSSNPTLIILISSLVTGLAIGGYFLLRKKKKTIN